MRAQEPCFHFVETPGPRRQKWRSSDIKQPDAQPRDWDAFLPLYSGTALPDWFVSGGEVRMDELEAVTAE